MSAARRPVIAICPGVERTWLYEWEHLAVTLPHSYSEAVRRAGGMALHAPPDPAWTDDPDELLDRIDGLILAGGTDMDPSVYGAQAHPETRSTNPVRDEVEVALARRALDRDMPLLGICRGTEVMVVACGGTLVQHLPDVLGHENHRRATGGGFTPHPVRLEPGSLAARAAGGEVTSVCSWHHQGPDSLGEGLVASGWGEPDGNVEAVEAPSRRYALGVLWHPEEDPESTVIGSLVEEARVAVAPS